MKEGLYTGASEKSFKSKREIEIENLDKPEFLTPLPSAKNFQYWSERLQERQEEYQEAKAGLNSVEIRLPETSSICFMSDLHIGGADVNYKRIEQEIMSILQTPNAYAVFLGDAVDGFFFNPAQMEAIEQVPEQYEYIQAMFKALGKEKKVLAGVSGDHDGWAKKMGLSAYSKFTEETGGALLEGVSYMTIRIENQEYKMTMAHRLPGASMYNKNHPQMRMAKFGSGFGSDLIISGHNHQKQLAQSTQTGFGGETNKINYVALGAYKSTDDYAKKLGFSQQQPEEMFGISAHLSKDIKRVRIFDSILEGNNELYKGGDERDTI